MFHLCAQTLKNALSPYRLGGSSGGSDFDPKGKSDNEVVYLFCYILFTEVWLFKMLTLYFGILNHICRSWNFVKASWMSYTAIWVLTRYCKMIRASFDVPLFPRHQFSGLFLRYRIFLLRRWALALVKWAICMDNIGVWLVILRLKLHISWRFEFE